MPVGMFSPAMSSSLMPSRCLTSARSELPWAVTSTVWPAVRSAWISFSQYGIIRGMTSLRHSVSGTSTPA